MADLTKVIDDNLIKISDLLQASILATRALQDTPGESIGVVLDQAREPCTT